LARLGGLAALPSPWEASNIVKIVEVGVRRPAGVTHKNNDKIIKMAESLTTLPQYLTRNQASQLPDELTETLAPLNKLKGRDDFDAWHYCVKSSLEQYDLEDLIDFTIPRPNESDNEYAIWARLSKRVKMWMTLQLSTSLIREISQSSEPSVYADDFIRLVKKLVLRDGHNLAHIVWLEALSMKRSQYGTIEQFITALRDKVQHSNRVDMPITAYQAASLLLKNVHRELPNYVEAKFLELSKIPRGDFTMQQFRGLCEEVRDQARGVAKVYSATPVQTSNQSQGQVQSQPDFTKRCETRTHRPENGVDIHEYVRKWRTSNKTSNGSCGYCEEPGHLPDKCPYLNVELRSDDWKPNPNLWVYYINWKINTEWKSKQIPPLPPEQMSAESPITQTSVASTVPYENEDCDIDFTKPTTISMVVPVPISELNKIPEPAQSGQKCYPLIVPEGRKIYMTDPQAIVDYVVGYGGGDIYNVWNKEMGKMKRLREVSFHDDDGDEAAGNTVAPKNPNEPLDSPDEGGQEIEIDVRPQSTAKKKTLQTEEDNRDTPSIPYRTEVQREARVVRESTNPSATRTDYHVPRGLAKIEKDTKDTKSQFRSAGFEDEPAAQIEAELQHRMHGNPEKSERGPPQLPYVLYISTSSVSI
jgi:hypothetical protein